MSNIALILAAGSGNRMNQQIPKQFMTVNEKPIVIYTLEAFQNHPEIDAIAVVCLDGWQEILRVYARQYGISKLQWVFPGGKTSQESISKGVFAFEGILDKDDIVIIHDGIRPVIDPSVITNVINVCRQYGNGVTAMPYYEQMFIADDDISTIEYIPRERLRRVSTPQAYRYELLNSKYHEAFGKEIGLTPSSYTYTMMAELGVRLYFAAGSDKNIKKNDHGRP